MDSLQPKMVFKIHGMDCAEEVALLKNEIEPLVGGEDRLFFDILNGRMAIESGAVTIAPETVMKAVARTGMRAELWSKDQRDIGQNHFWQRQGRVILAATSGVFTLLGFLVHIWIGGGVWAAAGVEQTGFVHQIPLTVRVLYGVAIVAGMWQFVPKAWRAALRLRPDMNLLMSVAVAGAICINEWFEAATVAFLFTVSLTLESWSIGRARQAVKALMDLTPPTVCVKRQDGSEVLIPPERVGVGEIFIVKPGERIPLDGRVARGVSHVNQAPITGESSPVPMHPGDEVFAGTINGDGALDINSTKPSGETTLAHIIRMIGEAQAKRAPSEQWVEKFARVYTPAVMGLALAILLIPTVVFGNSWQDWLYRALVLLVIACPCALVISTPVSIVAALAAAARNGVLIKGGMHVEAPARLKAVAFDKTGTLTSGKPTVMKIVPLSGQDELELLEHAAALEARSDHPLAQAIVAFAEERGITPSPAEEFQIIQGKGASGRLNGEFYWLGSHRYLEERGQETEQVHQRLEAMSDAGRTVVAVGNERHVCGLIALADVVRPEAKRAIQALRDLGIKHIAMLTGDNQGTAHAIAREMGVDEVHAALLPADKVVAVESLVAMYGSVAMVGDGVNDAPAMGRATLGIAMGTAGSDAAIETADIALMTDDLSRLSWLVGHSRRTLAIIRQNVVFSISVKAVVMALTIVGFATLWAAIAADAGASLLVTLNGLRLLQAGTVEASHR